MVPEYGPKGSMCIDCVRLYENCSKLPFNTMMVIKEYPDGFREVKCTYRVVNTPKTD